MLLSEASPAASQWNRDEAPHVHVRIYNFATARASEIVKAMTEVTALYQTAGVRLTWTECLASVTHQSDADPCRQTDYSFTVTLLQDAPSFCSRGALGFALVGVERLNHAAVILSRIDEISDLAVRSHLILACAIAHELGHLILGHRPHGSSGLLRSRWKSADILAIARGNMSFSPAEITRLHDALAARRTRAARIR
jgi:hypothetical protein